MPATLPPSQAGRDPPLACASGLAPAGLTFRSAVAQLSKDDHVGDR